MIGRQFGVLPSQAPKVMVTDPSAIFLRRDVVERVGVEGVLHKKAFGVVKADRPEAINRNILDREPIAVVPSFFAGVTFR